MPIHRTLSTLAILLPLLLAALPAGVGAQEMRHRLVFPLESDSAELAYVTDLVGTQLRPPVSVGTVSGEFTSGRIYPFGGTGNYLVAGVLTDVESGEAIRVLYPFGSGLEGAPPHVLGPAGDPVEISGVGDIYDNGMAAVFYCDRSSGGAVPTVLEFDGAWRQREIGGLLAWRCA